MFCVPLMKLSCLNEKNINFEHTITSILVEKLSGGTIGEGPQFETIR